jgi:hypothetical protein
MGHADARTTARYSHYRERGDEAARLAAAYAPRAVPESDSNAEGETSSIRPFTTG